MDCADPPTGDEFPRESNLREEKHGRRADESQTAAVCLVTDAPRIVECAGDRFLAVDVLAGRQRRQGGLRVGLNRGEVDHRLGIALGEHGPVIVIPCRDVVLVRDLAHSLGGATTDGDQLRSSGQPVHLRQIVALRDVAATKECQFYFSRHQPSSIQLTAYGPSESCVIPSCGEESRVHALVEARSHLVSRRQMPLVAFATFACHRQLTAGTTHAVP